MSFHVGQKVVCIDAEWSHPAPFPCPLRLKAVYTVRRVRQSFGGRYREQVDPVCIWLHEVESPFTDCEGPDGFAVARFRPVVTRKTSIEVFQRILDNPRLPIREDA